MTAPRLPRPPLPGHDTPPSTASVPPHGPVECYHAAHVRPRRQLSVRPRRRQLRPPLAAPAAILLDVTAAARPGASTRSQPARRNAALAGHHLLVRRQSSTCFSWYISAWPCARGSVAARPGAVAMAGRGCTKTWPGPSMTGFTSSSTSSVPAPSPDAPVVARLEGLGDRRGHRVRVLQLAPPPRRRKAPCGRQRPACGQPRSPRADEAPCGRW